MKKIISILMALAILFSLAMPAMAADEIKIPIAIELPYEVAGVELEVTHTEGVTFSTWERPRALRTAGYVTNIRKDDGYLIDTNVLKAGIFSASNIFTADENGILDLGYLVFKGTTAGQSVTVHVAEFVHVVSKTETENGAYGPFTVTLPLQNNEGLVFGGEMSGDVSDSSDSVTPMPKPEAGEPGTVGHVNVSLKGEDTVDTDEDLVYTVSVKNATSMATADITVELDADFVEDPYVEGCNGFQVIEPKVTEKNGKLVVNAVIFSVEGITSDAATDIMVITAENKGEEGEATAKLTGFVPSCYVGDSEAFMDYTVDNATATTTVEEDNLSSLFPFIIGGAAGGSPISVPFVDVVEGAWYYDSVASAWANDLIDGVTATEYMPEKTLTVAEAIKLAAVLYQKDNEGVVTLVNGTNKWYTTYVNYAVENGIIEEAYKNYTDAQMNAAVSRAEFVHIFHGAMDNYYVINAVGDNNIPDVKLGDYAADEIYEFYRAGICIGNDRYGTFLPNNSIKRSEVATILNRMYDLDAREIVHLP